MPTEIITTKRNTDLGRLLERVIRDHRKDISDYSKGKNQVLLTYQLGLHQKTLLQCRFYKNYYFKL